MSLEVRRRLLNLAVGEGLAVDGSGLDVVVDAGVVRTRLGCFQKQPLGLHARVCPSDPLGIEGTPPQDDDRDSASHRGVLRDHLEIHELPGDDLDTVGWAHISGDVPHVLTDEAVGVDVVQDAEGEDRGSHKASLFCRGGSLPRRAVRWNLHASGKGRRDSPRFL